MSEAAIKFSVVNSDAGFRELESDWRRLSQAVDPTHFFQSFDWCWHAWHAVSSKAGRRLRILVGRVDGDVVLIFPLMAAGPFLRVLGSELFEFHDVLVLPTPHRDTWLRSALEAIKRLSGSAILLRDVRQDGDLSGFLCRQKYPARSRVAGKTSFVRLHDFAGWPDYFESLHKQLKSDQRRQWKRLAELADPGRFEMVEDPSAQLEMLQWLHSEKCKWLDSQKSMSGGGFFGSENYRNFLFAVVPVLAAQGQVMMCRIVSGTETLAGLLGFICRDYFIFFMFAYDPKWSPYSPGRLVMAKAIEWCYSRNIGVFDMLLGSEDYKAVWSTHTLPIQDYFVPLGLEGRFIETWHASGCSRFFAKPWFDAISRIAPGRLRKIVSGRLAAQRELITEMRPL
jgi:CelD/BcsL family acetyltransferase involved in cellulose biosynthesis